MALILMKEHQKTTLLQNDDRNEGQEAIHLMYMQQMYRVTEKRQELRHFFIYLVFLKIV